MFVQTSAEYKLTIPLFFDDQLLGKEYVIELKTEFGTIIPNFGNDIAKLKDVTIYGIAIIDTHKGYRIYVRNHEIAWKLGKLEMTGIGNVTVWPSIIKPSLLVGLETGLISSIEYEAQTAIRIVNGAFILPTEDSLSLNDYYLREEKYINWLKEKASNPAPQEFEVYDDETNYPLFLETLLQMIHSGF